MAASQVLCQRSKPFPCTSSCILTPTVLTFDRARAPLLAVQVAEAKDLGVLLRSNAALRLELAATRARVAELEGAAQDPVAEQDATAAYIAKYLSKAESRVGYGSRGGGWPRWPWWSWWPWRCMPILIPEGNPGRVI